MKRGSGVLGRVPFKIIVSGPSRQFHRSRPSPYGVGMEEKKGGRVRSSSAIPEDMLVNMLWAKTFIFLFTSVINSTCV